MHPFSGSLGSTVAIKELSTSLGKLGLQVFIFTPYETDKELAENVCVKNIPTLFGRLGIGSKTYHVSRLMYYNKAFMGYVYLNKKIQQVANKKLVEIIAPLFLENDIDVVHAEQDMIAPLGLELSKETNLPFVARLHNITSEELVSGGVIKPESKEFHMFQMMNEQVLSQADLVLVVNNALKEYVLTNYGLQKDKVVIVPTAGRPRIRDLPIRAASPKIVYSGLVSYRERVDLFVKSMPKIRGFRQDAQFFVTKKGDNLGAIKKLVSRANVSVNFFWYPKTQDFFEFLSSCHIGILTSSDDTARRIGTAVKMFDYMSVGLPVVANDIGGWSKMIETEKVGILTKENELASGVVELLRNPEMVEECGKRALEVVRTKYNWDNSALTYYHELQRVCGD